MNTITDATISKEETRVVTEEEREMMEAGLHLGHQTSKLHPRMEKFVVGIRNTVHIIDLEVTKQKLDLALDYISQVVSKGGIVLFVGTKLPYQNLIKEIGDLSGMPYVKERWLGGTFTNFSVIKKRVDHFKDLKRQQESGAFEKYTKKEQSDKQKEITDLERKFGGLVSLERIPDVVFICDLTKDDSCFKEARIKGVKVVAQVDTNVDPLLVDFPIPANDDAITAVRYILEKVKEVILKSKK
ncbi:MAG: 30S ribosomal protein S2 [Candidatus Gribaldobacteria bacterium]|nr:30S ribosomal protein S2 [Candidatus Gribaldobacteria bacterium]